MAEVKPVTDEDRAELIAYLDGELDEPAARVVEARITQDPRIRAEADALRKTYDLLDYLPKPEPSPSFTHRTMTKVSEFRPSALQLERKHRWRQAALGFSWAAALVLAIMGGYVSVPLVHRPAPKTAPVDDVETQLARDLRVIENLRLYQHAGDIFMLHDLDRPELFGDESNSQ